MAEQNLEVTVESLLPRDEPQGQYVIKISSDSTVEKLLQQLCQETGTLCRPDYRLRNKNLDILEPSNTLAESGIQNGSHLHWSKETTHVVTWGWCNRIYFPILLSVTSLVVGSVGLTSVLTVHFLEVSPEYDFAVVFDAGSTHTSMFIYTWEGSKLNGTVVASQFDKCEIRACGIATFQDNPENAGKYLQGCIDQATKSIPQHKHNSTQIYLGATAGMRLLENDNSTASEAILESVRQTFLASPFNFTDPDWSVRIIDGADEGTYSWITTNYVAYAFRVKYPGMQGLPASVIVPSIGALDLGGASTQITFVPQDVSDIPENYTRKENLFGHTYTLYAFSYLCYGIVQFTTRIFYHIAMNHIGSTEFDHPCLPRGFNMTRTKAKITHPYCAPPIEVLKDSNYTFIGKGNSAECEALVSDALFGSCTREHDKEGITCEYQPYLYGPFYAFSGFFYNVNFLNLTNSETFSFDHIQFVNATQELCSMDWSQLQQLPLTRFERMNLMYYCLNLHYINQLLYYGYGFNDTLWKGINFVRQVSGVDVGWTLGYLLSKSNQFPARTRQVRISPETFYTLTTLFSLSTVGGLCAMALAKKPNWLRFIFNRIQQEVAQYTAI